jgi:hypothetical protein
MFTLFLVAVNFAAVALGLVNLGEQSDKPKGDDDDYDSSNYPCV